MDGEFKPTRERFEKSAKDWFRWYAFWLYAHYIVGLLIVIIGVLIAADMMENYVKVLGVLSGILAATVTFLRPNEKAAIFRARWHGLNSILLDPSNDDLSKVYDAYVKAEALTTASVMKLGESTSVSRSGK